MNLAASYPAPALAPPKSAAAESRRIGNANHSSAFDESGEAFEPSWDRLSASPPRRDMCQNGTLEIAPLWHGPAMRPAFAAQVLGQVLMYRNVADAGRAARSYHRGILQVSSALLFDVTI